MVFRGASAEAMGALSGQLDGQLGGAVSGDARKVGLDLFAVAGVLRAEPGLRRVATDVAVSAEAKTGLVRDVFGGKVDQGALTLTTDAVGRRWTTPRDLPHALEQLGVMAVVRSARDEASRLSDELFAFGQTVKDSSDLRDALSDPARSVEDKRTLVRGLLEGRALPATIALVDQSLAGTHRTVGVALAEYQKVAAEDHGQSVATIRVAQPLADADRRRLTEVLTRQYDRSMHVNVVVDPQVIGGIRVEVGDDVIDGTVASRLDDARRKLAG
ncbi:F0F1 ATP synthase subunit delta [Nocardioides sp.]|uniref:F0F1 ATP synthase subunit delta n=1 Tax=Nocardioides sp. TaxID=35761 RepID=UPI002733ACE4|nr:F0F1 ATP synthase subunit delta [Nocardioides sp.]MDP3890712.1 F0F1 ATP synthase subunit delta [Nocardioides sp.]